jgi:hypothetical protein
MCNNEGDANEKKAKKKQNRQSKIFYSHIDNEEGGHEEGGSI